MKKIFSLILFMFALTMANAQEAIETPKLTDNMYFGVGVGATTPLNLDNVFPLNAAANVRLGKDFTPVFGAMLEGTVLFGNNDFKVAGDNVVRALNLGGDFTVNLTNLFLGYKEGKTFNLRTVTGIGWLQKFNAGISENKYDDDELTAKTGLNFAWGLGKEKAHKLFVEPAVYWNLTSQRGDAVTFNKNHAQLGVMVGWVYNFKCSNGTHDFKVYNVGAMNDEINRLRAQGEKVVEKEVPVEKEVVKEVVKEVNASDILAVVEFAQNSSKLTDSAKSTLDAISANNVVIVKATASPEGSKKYNKTLSQKRADVVKAYLEEKGVKVDSAEGLGVVSKESNRIAIVSAFH